MPSSAGTLARVFLLDRAMIDLMTIAEAAHLLGVCTNTVRTMIARGEMEAVHVGSRDAKRRTLRISRDELESFIRTRGLTPKPIRSRRLSDNMRSRREMASIVK